MYVGMVGYCVLEYTLLCVVHFSQGCATYMWDTLPSLYYVLILKVGTIIKGRMK